MLLWLGETAGLPKAIVVAARRGALEADPSLASMSAAIRRAIPFATLEHLLHEKAFPAMTNPPRKEDLGQVRRDFWSFFVDRFPGELESGRPTKLSSRWHLVEGRDLNVALYLSDFGVSVFVRGPRAEPIAKTPRRLEPYRTKLEAEFRTAMLHTAENADGIFIFRADGELRDKANWPWMAEWLMKHAKEWEANLIRAIERPTRSAPG
jgi:hypothetical protein